MTESLVLRVKRLVSGSLNGLVDALETANAEVVMREAVREIETAIDDVKEELGRVVASSHQNRRIQEKMKAKLVELTERATLAVSQGRDDLAEAAIARQMDFEGQIPALEKSLDELTAKKAELEGYVAALEDRKREMEADIAAFVAARETAADIAGTTGGHGSVGASAERRADRAQKAFDRAMNGSAGTPGMPKSDRETLAKLNELERMARSSKIADRLASLKATKAAS
ncbi:MAG TPA: PspA/IM30 family protein [Hyphomicrobiaceae bacterium]|nr:PspA/IM30 family protein [Hyphomicrobiaceae bacterium]